MVLLAYQDDAPSLLVGLAAAVITCFVIYRILMSWGQKNTPSNNQPKTFSTSTTSRRNQPQQTDSSIEEIFSAATRGDARAQAVLAAHYHNLDPSMTVFWSMRSAQQGCADGQFILGSCYQSGIGGLEKNWEKAEALYQSASSGGCAPAKDALSELLSKRRVQEEFERKKKEQNQQEQEKSNRSAETHHACFTLFGLSPSCSETEAKTKYRELAKQYHPDRVSHLGPEFRTMATQKFSELNAAYEKIKHIRGW